MSVCSPCIWLQSVEQPQALLLASITRTVIWVFKVIHMCTPWSLETRPRFKDHAAHVKHWFILSFFHELLRDSFCITNFLYYNNFTKYSTFLPLPHIHAFLFFLAGRNFLSFSFRGLQQSLQRHNLPQGWPSLKQEHLDCPGSVSVHDFVLYSLSPFLALPQEHFKPVGLFMDGNKSSRNIQKDVNKTRPSHVKTHKLLHICKQVVTTLFTSCQQVVFAPLVPIVVVTSLKHASRWKLVTSLMALSDLLQGCSNKSDTVMI
jgi:hypothetical protein